MSRNGFGQILRSSREYQGISIDAAASRLRIRPDILRSIEEGDFSRMPQRGYARNMINAYARFLGLNATELTTMYLDELHAYQASVRGTGFDSVTGSSRGSRSSRGQRGQQHTMHDQYGKRRTPPYSETTGRAIYSDRTDRNPIYDQEDYGRRTARQATTRDRSRQRGMDRGNRGYAEPAAVVGRQRSYDNLFSVSRPNAIISKLPIILIAILVVVLLGFAISSVASCATSKKDADVSNVPISGISDTTNTNDNTAAETAAPVLTPPTAATFQYSIASGKNAYFEIYENDSDVPSDADEVTGPVSNTYQVTTKLKFVTTSPEAVKLTVDGTEVQPKDDSDGIYVYTVDFPSILAAWNAVNGPKAQAAQAAAANAAAAAANAASNTSNNATNTR